MSWRKLTEENLIAALSRAEVEAFKQDFEIDAVERLLSDTTAEVRGYIDAGRKCRMDPDASTIPPMLVTPTIEVAAFRLLKRIDIIPNEARKTAYERALSLFEKVAAGQIVPPDYGAPAADDTKQAVTAPAASGVTPPRLLD